MIRTAIVLLLLTTIAARAEEPRKIDFTTVLTDLDGKPIADKDAPPVTLGDVTANALFASYRDEQPSGQDKVKRWTLALRVHKAQAAELTADEIKLIKDLIGKGYGPLIVGQAWQILDPASVK